MNNDDYRLDKEKLVHPTFDNLFPDFESFDWFVRNDILSRYFLSEQDPNNLPDYLNKNKMIYDYNVIYWSLYNRYSDWTAVNNEKKTKQLFANALVQLLPNLYLKSQSLSPELLRKITEEKEELLNISLIKENIDPESNFIESMDQTSSTPNDPEQMLKYGRDLLNAREFNKSRTIDKTKTKRTHINVLERYNRLVYLSASNVLSMFVNSIEINSLFVYIDGNSYSRYYMVGNRGKRGETGLTGKVGINTIETKDGKIEISNDNASKTKLNIVGSSKTSITNDGETQIVNVEVNDGLMGINNIKIIGTDGSTKEQRNITMPIDLVINGNSDIDFKQDQEPYILEMTINDGKKGDPGEQGERGFKGKPGFDKIITKTGTTEINNISDKETVLYINGDIKTAQKETDKEKQVFLEINDGKDAFESVELIGNILPGSDHIISGDQMPDSGFHLKIAGTSMKGLERFKDDDDTIALVINDGKDAEIGLLVDGKPQARITKHRLNLNFTGNSKKEVSSTNNVNDTLNIEINDGLNAIDEYYVQGKKVEAKDIRKWAFDGTASISIDEKDQTLRFTINNGILTDKDGRPLTDVAVVLKIIYGDELGIANKLPFTFDSRDKEGEDINVNYDLDLDQHRIKLGEHRIDEKWVNNLENNINNKQEKIFDKVINKEYEGGEALSWKPNNHIDANNKKIYRLMVDERYETSAANLQYVDNEISKIKFWDLVRDDEKNKYSVKFIKDTHIPNPKEPTKIYKINEVSLDKKLLKEVGSPIDGEDATNKDYVEQRLTSELAKKQTRVIDENTGSWVLQVPLEMNQKDITNVSYLRFATRADFYVGINKRLVSIFTSGTIDGLTRIKGLNDPIDNKDAVNKNYVDDRIDALKRDITRLDNRMNTEIDKTWKDGKYQLSKKLHMNSKVIEYMATGTSSDESTRKDYIDNKFNELLNKINNLESENRSLRSRIDSKQDKMFRKNGDTWELID